MNEGGIIVDVRTHDEFKSGHIERSINIHLDQLKANLEKLGNKNQYIITCCVSGMRSASEKNILISSGHTHVYNGGGWYSLEKKIT